MADEGRARDAKSKGHEEGRGTEVEGSSMIAVGGVGPWVGESVSSSVFISRVARGYAQSEVLHSTMRTLKYTTHLSCPATDPDVLPSPQLL